MRVYEKVFVNPLLALAFKEGIDFANDPDLTASNPKQEGSEWVVVIEDDNEENDDEVVYSSPGKITTTDVPPKQTFEDFQKMNDMTPVNAKRMGDNSIHPCGRCIPCASGGSCVEEVNAAIMNMSSR